MKLYKYQLPFLLVLGIVVQGCGVLLHDKKHDILPPPPESYQHGDSLADDITVTDSLSLDDPWWIDFQDSTLTSIMEEAFRANPTLEQSVARLKQFQAARRSAQSSWFPRISGSVSYTDAGKVLDEEAASGNPLEGAAIQSGAFFEGFNASVSAAYELDVWGKLAQRRSAAYHDLLAGEETLRATALTISAQVARTYYIIIELGLQRDLLQQTIDTYEDSYQLTNSRYDRGVAASVDIYQAETNLAMAKAQLTQVEANLTATRNTLSVLLGKYPDENLISGNLELPNEIADLHPGIPSDLLQRRPDVRAAYHRMESADQRWAAAVKDRIPSLSLSGQINGRGEGLGDAIDPDALFWNAVGNLTVPIFAGGRLKAEADRNEAVFDEAIAAYKQALLTAYKEVEDALIRAEQQDGYITQLERQVTASAATLRLVVDRYLRGVTDYLPVVSAQSAHFSAKRNLITAKRTMVDYKIQLITALGGSWTDQVLMNFSKVEKMNQETIEQ
ncbi:efflux transporter outer membrane subunit [bacterium]|nr:efflux transporter outer membrane subunit [bacterium]